MLPRKISAASHKKDSSCCRVTCCEVLVWLINGVPCTAVTTGQAVLGSTAHCKGLIKAYATACKQRVKMRHSITVKLGLLKPHGGCSCSKPITARHGTYTSKTLHGIQQHQPKPEQVALYATVAACTQVGLWAVCKSAGRLTLQV